MIKATLKTTEDNFLELLLPESLKEMSLNCKIAFDVCREDIAIWLQKCVEDATLFDDRTYYLYLVSRAVSEALGIDIIKVLSLDSSYLVNEEGELLPGVLERHLSPEKEEIDLASLEATIVTLYEYIVKITDSYIFEYKDLDNFKILYEGKNYEIPYVKTTLFTGEKEFGPITTAQAVEIMQTKKFINGKKFTFEKDKEGADILRQRTGEESNQEMSLRYTGFLKIIACLAIEEGKTLPLEDTAFTSFVTNQMATFKNIDAKLGMDIGFFLTIFTKT